MSSYNYELFLAVGSLLLLKMLPALVCRTFRQRGLMYKGTGRRQQVSGTEMLQGARGGGATAVIYRI